MRGARETITTTRLRLAAAGLLAALVAAVLASSGSAAPQSGLQQAILAQEQHSGALLARGGIVGTGVSQDAAGEAEIVVLATHPVQVARTLSGVDVEVKVTGPISSLKTVARKRPGGGGGTTTSEPSPTSRFNRPVPIGVSTGNAGECSAGTIGARVSDSSGNVYALSNNHVYARENKAALGSQVLQPGLYDTGCAFSAANVFGSLSAFEPIVFSTTASNRLDAAIAATTTAALGSATPPNGYGEPSSLTQAAVPGLAVQKYGRTTSLTSGTVTAINGIVNVSYSAGTARFVDQVFIEGQKPILKSGDSGSLLVTGNASANPVGLLFAGNSNGRFAIANPIDLVLNRFG
ncbi:MAG TPA: hypothetical protein VF729_09075, partial [Solirubrobacterales bacterium]